MGWSVDLILDEVAKIFGSNKHEVIIPESNRPYAHINYSKEIPLRKKQMLAALFPDDYYVKFHPNTLWEEVESPKVQEFPKGEEIQRGKGVEPVEAKVAASKDGKVSFPGVSEVH